MGSPLEPVVLSTREAPPTHYIFKIQSFSLLSKASIERYDSDIFEAGGHKWKLSFYPTGNKILKDQDHISLYLTMEDVSSLSLGWEVNVIFSLFVYDQFRDKYLTFQDGKIRRFHALKSEWGFTKFINLNTFKNPSNGYLVDDKCVFGAEVFVIKNASNGECSSIREAYITGTSSWIIDKFPVSSPLYPLSSPTFITGGYEWKIHLFRMGNGAGRGNSISLFLCLDDSKTPLPPATKLYVKFSVSVYEKTSGKPVKREASHLFSNSSETDPNCWGWPTFMPLGEFNDPKKNYVNDNICHIETQVSVLGVVTKFS